MQAAKVVGAAVVVTGAAVVVAGGAAEGTALEVTGAAETA